MSNKAWKITLTSVATITYLVTFAVVLYASYVWIDAISTQY